MCVAVVVLLLVGVSGAVQGAEGGDWKRSDDSVATQVLLQQLSQQLGHVTAQVAALQAQLKATSTSVAFQAQPSAGLVQLGADSTIVYDSVSLNIGKAYDDHTGFFTAPVSGTYRFSVTCMADSGQAVYLTIVLNDVQGPACFSARDSGEHSDLGTAVSTVHVRAGQRVWVKNRQHHSVSMAGDSWAVFSGFLVQPDM